jgi:RNA polymerase sigma-70 factor (ECF subfamily)
MNASTVDTLLAHEELLRALARDLLRDEHAVDDVVQQTWLVALQREPRMSEAFGAWLLRIARNFALRALRTSARRHERERRSAVVEALPSTQAILEREETRRRVVQAVIRLGEPHRAAIVLFYFEGLPPREIARRLGIPVETVRSRLKRARSELRAQLEREHGETDRGIHHMLLPLAGASGWSRWAAPAVPPALAGALLMTAKVKVGIAAACLVLGLGAGIALWSLADRDAPAREKLSAAADAIPREPPAARAKDPGTDARVEMPAAPDRSSLPAGEAATPAPATTGSLLVRTVWEQDGTPAENIIINVADRSHANAHFHTTTRITGADGTIRWEDLPPSNYEVDFSQTYDHVKSVRVVAGTEAEVMLKIPEGIGIEGIVVDASGAPVTGAAILTGAGAFSPRLERPPVARSAADGTFHLRGLPNGHEIAAVADGFAPSLWQWILDRDGKQQHVRLVLEERGGEVRGEVVDRNGEAVANALVRITLGKFEGYKPRQGALVATPKEAWSRSDEDGAFTIPSVPAGTFPIEVRADGYGTWRDRVEVSLQVAAEVRVELAQGASVHGTITTADGKPAAKIQVRVGWYPDVMSSATKTDAAGHFQLGELTPGEITVEADAEETGKATGVVVAGPGQDVEWNGVISTGSASRDACSTSGTSPSRAATFMPIPRDRRTARRAATSG